MIFRRSENESHTIPDLFGHTVRIVCYGLPEFTIKQRKRFASH
jgi:hypothetical protein